MSLLILLLLLQNCLLKHLLLSLILLHPIHGLIFPSLLVFDLLLCIFLKVLSVLSLLPLCIQRLLSLQQLMFLVLVFVDLGMLGSFLLLHFVHLLLSICCLIIEGLVVSLVSFSFLKLLPLPISLGLQGFLLE